MACHKKPLLLSVSGVGLLYLAIWTTKTVLQNVCRSQNYLIAFCETMWKPGAMEIKF